MIEYLLVFGLGFCAALLIGLVIAPTIRRRIVTLTERRMRATVALTSAEVRAEHDAARAADAMENRRLTVEAAAERRRCGALAAEKERMAAELAREREAGIALQRQVESLNDQTSAFRTHFRDQEELAAGLQASLASAERAGEEHIREIADLSARIDAHARQQDELKIDIATRDTQIETLKSQIGRLRDERRVLREELKAAKEAEKDFRIRLEREEERVSTLDAKLAESIATLSDRESELERRTGDIEQLRQKWTAATDQAAASAIALQQAQVARKSLEEKIARLQPDSVAAAEEPKSEGHEDGMQDMDGSHDNSAITRRIEKLRKRHATLVGTLADARDGRDDARLKDEIAEIAAMMVDLTAAREGPASPIHTILAAVEPDQASGDRPTLAERARRRIEASQGVGTTN